MNINADHFRLLRLALYRALTCEQVSPNVFRVSSSREGHPPYLVDVEKGCPCDSSAPCSHLALAVDRWHEREADIQARGDYFASRRLDFGGMLGRELKGDERRYVAACVERARVKYGALVVSAPREATNVF